MEAATFALDKMHVPPGIPPHALSDHTMAFHISRFPRRVPLPVRHLWPFHVAPSSMSCPLPHHALLPLSVAFYIQPSSRPSRPWSPHPRPSYYRCPWPLSSRPALLDLTCPPRIPSFRDPWLTVIKVSVSLDHQGLRSLPLDHKDHRSLLLGHQGH